MQAVGNPDLIRNLKRDRSSSPLAKSLPKLATVLGVSVAWLVTGDDEIEGGQDTESTEIGLTYGGIVEAGAFREVDMLNQDSPRIIPLPRDARYPRCRQYAFEVRGDSMNLAKIEEGMWVTGVDYIDFTEWHGEVRSGMKVVVERSRAQGAERELTVKELHFTRDHIEFVPRSSNPEHKPVKVKADFKADNGINIRVLAIVTGATLLFRYD